MIAAKAIVGASPFINPKICYNKCKKLKNIFKKEYLQPERPIKLKINVKLKL